MKTKTTTKPTSKTTATQPAKKTTAPVQQTRKQALESLLQKGADSQVMSQEALLAQARDKQLLEIQKGLENAVNEGKISVRDAEDQFNTRKSEIDKEAYVDTERTELMAQERGIQNSGMMLGLMQGDNARKDSMINENVTVRDQRINTITDRLNAIKNNSALDTANAHANYGYGVANARGQAESQRYQNEFAMGLEDMQANRDQGFTQDNMNMQQGFTQDNMQLQQGYTQDNMGMQQGFTQDNMKLQQQFDLSKMSTQQRYTLEQMAKSFGYDLSKMSQAQQYQLANMATSFGYDMQMQEDSQGHQNNMAYNERLFQEKMFGKEQGAKMAEYDLALQRETASYDANTPEGKLRIKQLEASKDAMVTEMMSKTIGELMGQSFISKYGEGMTTKQMETWLKDPTNLKNLETKVKKADLPEEKKGFLDAIIKGSKVATPIGAIYTGFTKLWKAGKESFSGADGGLGSLSAKYESSGNAGIIARTRGDIGGASYGKYQLTTQSGHASAFANSYGGSLRGKKAGTSAFDKAWKAEYAKNPKAFEQAQHKYIEAKHYKPALASAQKATGINFASYPKAVKDMIWSIGVQHGAGGTANVFRNAGIRSGDSASTIIKKVYAERMKVNKYFSSSSQSVKNGVLNRFKRELQDALRML